MVDAALNPARFHPECWRERGRRVPPLKLARRQASDVSEAGEMSARSTGWILKSRVARFMAAVMWLHVRPEVGVRHCLPMPKSGGGQVSMAAQSELGLHHVGNPGPAEHQFWMG